MTEKKFKTRWNRWLGQKCKVGGPYWTDLLNSSWSGWARKVLRKKRVQFTEPILFSRLEVKAFFKLAIEHSDMNDLEALDAIYCEKYLNR